MRSAGAAVPPLKHGLISAKKPTLADQLVQNPALEKKQVVRGIASVPTQLPVVVIPPVQVDGAVKASDDYSDMGPAHRPQP